jgi:hypothetical protein
MIVKITGKVKTLTKAFERLSRSYITEHSMAFDKHINWIDR